MTRLNASWLTEPGTQSFAQALIHSGYQALFVGGCVRNTLLSEPVNDIDMSTDALPHEVARIAEALGFKSIATGIDHGTVTVVTDTNIAIEVTTFRHDIATDGRHAKVAFSTSVTEDAKRRDFTMNALYADANGQIIDPVNGLPDIEVRKVRFVGDAQSRIQEDYLRVLRFFRFHAWYGDPEQGIDPDGLAACATNLDGLGSLSRERVGSEMIKLLGAPDPAPSVASMHHAGVLPAVMPGTDPKPLPLLIHLEAGNPIDWRRRAAVLGGETLNEAWRLAKRDAKHLAKIQTYLSELRPPAEVAYFDGEEVARNTSLVRAALFEQPLEEGLEEQIAAGSAAKFPVKAADLSSLSGKELGEKLSQLETEWVASGFTKSKETLLGL